MTNQEARLRRWAKRRGFRISKSRRRRSLDNYGLFELLDDRNNVVLGFKCDATLDEIEAYLEKVKIIRRWGPHAYEN